VTFVIFDTSIVINIYMPVSPNWSVFWYSSFLFDTYTTIHSLFISEHLTFLKLVCIFNSFTILLSFSSRLLGWPFSRPTLSSVEVHFNLWTFHITDPPISCLSDSLYPKQLETLSVPIESVFIQANSGLRTDISGFNNVYCITFRPSRFGYQ